MLNTNVLYYGVDEPLPAQIRLHAGPLSLIYENGDLRYIKLGDHEILRRIYVAVRDPNWGTAANQLSNVEMQIGEDEFQISYNVENREGDIDFAWKGQLTGTADGVIRFRMAGVARSTFVRNRIGFCVLHPAACAGAPARIEHVDGTTEETRFPELIAVQRVVDGTIKPVAPFEEMAALSYEVMPGLWATVRFSGEIFETEDQRNWTDASFKTYGTPLRLPFPVEVPAGTEIAQTITLMLQGEIPAANSAREKEQISVVVDAEPLGTLPLLGLGIASHGQPLTEQEIGRLQALHLHHLRVDLRLQDDSFSTALEQATAQATALGVLLEVGLYFTEAYGDEARTLADIARELAPPVWAWLLFKQGATSTPRAWIEQVGPILRAATPEALIGGGTDAFFTELNRTPPPLELIDLVTYSVNPQVHAFDNASLMETLAAQGATATSARAFTGECLLSISPVTLRMRSNPNATGPEPSPAPGVLPPQVDPRQMSLFGAGWTLGSLKYLAENGADSVTYYETTGWRGVMESAAGSALPDQFRSLPGAVFPLYHVLADVGEFAGSQILPLRSDEPLAIDGLALLKADKVCVLIANLSSLPQTVILSGPEGDASVRMLDEQSVMEAMRAPETFRGDVDERRALRDGVLDLTLSPYAVARIDL